MSDAYAWSAICSYAGATWGSCASNLYFYVILMTASVFGVAELVLSFLTVFGTNFTEKVTPSMLKNDIYWVTPVDYVLDGQAGTIWGLVHMCIMNPILLYMTIMMMIYQPSSLYY